MSTKKTTKPTAKKPEAKKPAVPTVTLKDGTTTEKKGVFGVDADGKIERIDQSEVANAKFLTVTVRDSNDGSEETYAVHISKTDKGNFKFKMCASDTLVTKHEKCEELHVEKNTLVGRGEYAKAVCALHQCWTAWASNFGIANAYRMVSCELVPCEYDGRKFMEWQATLASAIDILG